MAILDGEGGSVCLCDRLGRDVSATELVNVDEERRPRVWLP